METLLRALWVWGAADSLWLALNPAAWARFWGKFIGSIERRPLLSSTTAAIQLGLSLYMLRRSLRGGR
jgi:hypothetical protein